MNNLFPPVEPPSPFSTSPTNLTEKFAGRLAFTSMCTFLSSTPRKNPVTSRILCHGSSKTDGSWYYTQSEQPTRSRRMFKDADTVCREQRDQSALTVTSAILNCRRREVKSIGAVAVSWSGGLRHGSVFGPAAKTKKSMHSGRANDRDRLIGVKTISVRWHYV